MISDIRKSSRKHGVPAELVAAILFQESGFRPDALNDGGEKGRDRGIGQINSNAFPNVTDEQAFNQSFGVDFATKTLRSTIAAFPGDLRKGILAYNRGIRGVREGRPDVNNYVQGVIDNLDPRFAKDLGLLDDVVAKNVKNIRVK